MADQRRSDFCVVFTMNLCALELKKDLNGSAISHHMALTLDVNAPRSNLKLIYEYKFHILPNKNVCAAKDQGKNYTKNRPSLVCHLLCN